MRTIRISPLVCSLFFAGLLSAASLQAQVVWDGGGADNNWSNNDNWTTSAPSAPFNNTVTMNGSTQTTNENNISGLSLTGLTFNNSDWNVSGQAFTLAGTLTGAAGRSVTISNDIAVSGNRTFQTNNTAASILTLSGSLSAGSSTITKDGSGTSGNPSLSNLVFDGSGETVTIGTFAHRKGGIIFENGVSASIGTFQLGNDATHNDIDPVVTIRGASTEVSTSGNLEIARAANAARLNLESGTLTANTLLTGQSATSLATSGYYQTGGIANIGNLRGGNNGASTISVAGGTMNVAVTNASNSKLVEGGTSTMTISGGNVNFTAATVSGATITFTGATGAAAFNLATAAGTGNLNLNGGTLTVGAFTKSNTTGTTAINLNGGTLRAGASSTSFLPALTNTTVNVGNGGAVIDTNSFDITIAAPLLNGGSGGLTKNSAGVLTLTGANTYIGNTTVNAGTLTLSSTSELLFAIGASGVNNSVSGAGTVNFNGTFKFDLTGAAAVGTWVIVDVGSLTETFGGTFIVDGFTDNLDGTWSQGDYTFSQMTGTLSAIPEPGTFGMLALAAALLAARRRWRTCSSS